METSSDEEVLKNSPDSWPDPADPMGIVVHNLNQMLQNKEFPRVLDVIDVGISEFAERVEQLNELLVREGGRRGKDHVDNR